MQTTTTKGYIYDFKTFTIYFNHIIEENKVEIFWSFKDYGKIEYIIGLELKEDTGAFEKAIETILPYSFDSIRLACVEMIELFSNNTNTDIFFIVEQAGLARETLKEIHLIDKIEL